MNVNDLLFQKSQVNFVIEIEKVKLIFNLFKIG